MRHLRRSYYNMFSKVYDGFVALHSSDRQGIVRRYFSSLVPVDRGETVLDVCTGTGALLPYLRARIGTNGSVVGVDFSRGMLSANLRRTGESANIHLVEADAACLPFPEDSFDAVTCTHAFYELNGEGRERALREIARVLKPGKAFLMMEHDIPRNPIVRALFYFRMASMGAGKARWALKNEKGTLEKHFRCVKKALSPSGHSKIMICLK